MRLGVAPVVNKTHLDVTVAALSEALAESLTESTLDIVALNGGLMAQTPDPVINTLFSLLDRATAPKAGEVYTSEDSAVAAAMEKEVETVISQITKRKK